MKKVLILGKSAKEYSLAKFMSEDCEVFVLPGNPAMADFATLVNIDDYNPQKIVEFVDENHISLTVPADSESISEELIQLYEKNGYSIFSPDYSVIQLLKDKVAIKKLLYKLHLPTPRFASFDKTSAAYDYVKNVKMPVIIKSNLNEYATVCVNERIAKTAIDDLTLRNENILIEEYLNGQTFTIYFITDGYKVLSIGSALNYNFSLEGDGGVLTNGIGACSPYHKLTKAHIDFLTYTAGGAIIDYFDKQGTPYLGIFGLECILTDDRLFVSNIKYFISDADIQGILALLNVNLPQLIDDCLMGIFADTCNYIDLKEEKALSLIISARKDGEIIEGLKNLDENTLYSLFPVNKNKYLEYETIKGKVINLTVVAGTISRCREKLYSEVKEIDFCTKTYRKDIGAIMSDNRGLI